jgi:pentatricopeptide repeat protein
LFCIPFLIQQYNAIIEAYAKIGNFKLAEHFLRTMISNYLQSNVRAKPDCKSFSIVIDGYTCGPLADPSRAESVFHRMLRLHASGKINGIQPTVSIYGQIIVSYAQFQKPQHAQRILLSMEDDISLTVPQHLYEVVIDAWNKSSSPKKKIFNRQLIRKKHATLKMNKRRRPKNSCY